MIVGGTGTAVFDLQTVKPGRTRLRLAYVPPGGQAATDEFTVEIVVR